MSKANTSDKFNKTLTVLGIVMCVIQVPILIVNCTLLVKSLINKDEVPDFGGTVTLIVLSDSMQPEIKVGDMIICKKVDPAKIEIGDVISFYDPAGNGTTVVTHRVESIINENGLLGFRTKGINNNNEDSLPVYADKVIAEYTGIRIPLAGNVAIFMQTTPGLFLCVVLPIILLVGYDVLRRKMYEKKQGSDIAALMSELEALKAEKAKSNTSAPEDADAQNTEQNETAILPSEATSED